jgi:glutathione S-transferase
MIELFQFGPAFNLPSPSPFCIKLELLLKMARIPYTNRYDADVRKAPKAKLPYIIIDGKQTMADSELILRHLKDTGLFRVDEWLSEAQTAQCAATTRLVEDHLYWLMVESRWLNDGVWPEIKKKFFSGLPPVVNTIVPALVRKQVRKTLYAQGLGRHNREELDFFAKADLTALDNLLGDRDYMMGERICSVDATVYGILTCIYYPDFNTPLKTIALEHPSLLAYCERITGQYFQELKRTKP